MAVMDANQLQANVLRTIQQYNLFLPDDTLIIALSGGADSLGLLLLLHDLQPQLQVKLHAAILNHGIRPEAKQEGAYVKTITKKLGIELHSGFRNVPQIAQEKGGGLELAARITRYEFLAEVAQKYGASKIVTGHHADDQAETILLHLIRGTGLKGLGGMHMISPMPYSDGSLELVRPLLHVTHQQLLDYCAHHQVQPIDDLSNQDTEFSRNFLRQRVMPLLKELNPKLVATMSRTAETVNQDVTYFDAIVSELLQDHNDYILVDRKAYQDVAEVIQRRIVLEAVLRLGGEPSHERILEGVRIGTSGEVGKIVEFAAGVRLRVDYETLIFERGEGKRQPDSRAGQCLLQAGTKITVRCPGTTPIPGQGWSLVIEVADGKQDSPDVFSFSPDAKLLLRTRRPGDRIKLRGMDGKSKKVKNWMIDRKVPRTIRDSIPLLIIDGEVGAILYDERLIPAGFVGVTTKSKMFWRIFVNFS